MTKLFKYVVAIVLLTTTASLQAQGVGAPLMACLKQEDSLLRLKCYDELAKQVQAEQQAQYIEPENAFLLSELRVNPQKSEFSLTVGDFVALIDKAVTPEKKEIKINGWRLDEDNHYALDIQFRGPVEVHFVHHPSDERSSFTVLQPVNVKGHTMDPTQFIMVIAAMVPG